MNFLWYILIGILSGFVAGKLMRGGGFGIVVNLIVGIIAVSYTHLTLPTNCT